MKKSLLHELHEDILKERGYYSIYLFVTAISFLITIEDIKLVIQGFRIILTAAPLVILVLVYFKFKSLRTKEENAKIIKYMLFFALLTLGTIVNFIRDL